MCEFHWSYSVRVGKKYFTVLKIAGYPYFGTPFFLPFNLKSIGIIFLKSGPQGVHA